jgi:hypothetical protein
MVTLGGMLTLAIGQFQKAAFPMLVTLFGMFMLARLLQS